MERFETLGIEILKNFIKTRRANRVTDVPGVIQWGPNSFSVYLLKFFGTTMATIGTYTTLEEARVEDYILRS